MIEVNETLLPGNSRVSPNQHYMLVYQPDGSVVVYDGQGPGGHSARWASGIEG
jgi:hypothetical protein